MSRCSRSAGESAWSSWNSAWASTRHSWQPPCSSSKTCRRIGVLRPDCTAASTAHSQLKVWEVVEAVGLVESSHVYGAET